MASLPLPETERDWLDSALTDINGMQKDLLISQLQDQVEDKDQVQKEFVQQYRESISSLQATMQSVIEENERLKNDMEQITRNMEQITRERDQLQQQLARPSTNAIIEEHDGPTPSPKEEEDWVIGREEVVLTEEIIGAGAYGEVKVAHFRGIKVAAKFLHKVIISDYNVHLFMREMTIASKLRHPHLVQFMGATKETHPVIIIELMPTNLNTELEKAPLSGRGILSIAQDVACALNYLHLWKPHPILHRDVSSKNVLLETVTSSRQWKAKLSDFGSANIQSYTATQVPGNPCYAPPEAISPDSHSPAMDVYSCGMLLMEMCVRQPPGMTREEKQHQFESIKWQDMKLLIQYCINDDRHKRPTISQVLKKLQAFTL